jgi:hypothetical protein
MAGEELATDELDGVDCVLSDLAGEWAKPSPG